MSTMDCESFLKTLNYLHMQYNGKDFQIVISLVSKCLLTRRNKSSIFSIKSYVDIVTLLN